MFRRHATATMPHHASFIYLGLGAATFGRVSRSLALSVLIGDRVDGDVRFDRAFLIPPRRSHIRGSRFRVYAYMQVSLAGPAASAAFPARVGDEGAGLLGFSRPAVRVN